MSEKKMSSANLGYVSRNIRQELQLLTGSINEIMKNMQRIQNPILESQEKLPIANQQLDKVSAQTEQAAHQMLDMVEQIIEQQEQITQLSEMVSAFIKKSRSQEKNAYLEKIQQIGEMSSVSQNNAFLIMDALQFQDITSQQIQHASAVLEDIEKRLHQLMAVLDGDEVPEELNHPESNRRAYDPDADLFNGKDQSEVDEIVSQIATKV